MDPGEKTIGEIEIAEARSALFALLCGAPHRSIPKIHLSAEQWDWIAETARDHRLQPLLNVIAQDAAVDSWPPELRDELRHSYRRHARRNLAYQAAMRRIGATFTKSGVIYVYLKGAALGPTVYPQGGMRPLRDLDILVEPQQASRAQELVTELGYRPLPGAARSAPAEHYQLPALLHPETKVAVEVHRALAPASLFDSDALAAELLSSAREHRIAGGTVRLAAPEALYCHLLLHAGIKSRFDCGPLVIADLAFLDAAYPEHDFASAADRFGLGRSAALFHAILARHGTASAARTRASPKVEAMADHAASLLSLPSTAVRARQLGRELRERTSFGRKLIGFVRGAGGATPAKISSAVGGRIESRTIWLRYPLWLANRAALLIAGGSDPVLAREVNDDLVLQRWLGAGES